MEDTIRTMQHALDALLEEGFALFRGTIQGNDGEHTLIFMKRHTPYQSWYTKALRVIRQLYPERYDDFQAHYRAILSLQRMTPHPSWYCTALRVICTLTAKRSQDAKDHTRDGHYGHTPGSQDTASHVCMGMAITPNGDTISRVHMAFLAQFHQQLSILNSVRDGLEYVLADMQSALYGEVGDHVLATVYTLFQHGHRRAAGALAGVLLEIHLAQVAAKYRVTIRPKSPDITVLNAALKHGGIYDVEVWRFIQRLGALRDVCVEAPEPAPTVDDLTTFIHGVQTVRKRVG